MNIALSQIDQATQQNASLIEETASLAEELAAQARELLELVSFFKTGETKREPVVSKGTLRTERPAGKVLTFDNRKVRAVNGNGRSDNKFEEF